MFKIGDRVQLGAWLDRWMMGDRYGTVIAVRRKISVQMDRSGKTIRLGAEDLVHA